MPVSVVTGGTGGIGIHIAAGLVAAGHQVIVTGRDRARGDAAVTHLSGPARREPAATFVAVDHATVGGNLSAAERLAGLVDHVDVVVNNVGGIFSERTVTDDGYETTVAVNFVGPAALTLALAPLLRAAREPRCVNVVSSAFRMVRDDPTADSQSLHDRTGIAAYARAKLLTILWTHSFAPELEDIGGRALCVNPGMAWTPNTRAMTPAAVPAWRPFWPVMRWVQRRGSPERAARAPLYAATTPRAALPPELYLDERSRPRAAATALVAGGAAARARELADRLISSAPTAAGRHGGQPPAR